MQESIKKYALNLLILTLILTAAGFGLFHFLFSEYYFSMFPLVPFFLFATTLIIHIYLVKASQHDARKFTSKYLASMGLKLFVYIIFIAVFIATAVQYAMPFLVSFLVCYAAFTLVEVIAILKYQKNA